MKQVLSALKAIADFGAEPAALAGKVLITTGFVVGGIKIFNATSEKVVSGTKYLINGNAKEKIKSLFSRGNTKEKINPESE